MSVALDGRSDVVILRNMNAATKKFTARNLPALLRIAEGAGFEVSKCDSKTYDFTLPSVNGRGLSQDEVNAARTLTDEIERAFAAFDLHVDNRHRFVRATWTKGSRSLVQVENRD